MNELKNINDLEKFRNLNSYDFSTKIDYENKEIFDEITEIMGNKLRIEFKPKGHALSRFNFDLPFAIDPIVLFYLAISSDHSDERIEALKELKEELYSSSCYSNVSLNDIIQYKEEHRISLFDDLYYTIEDEIERMIKDVSKEYYNIYHRKMNE